ncbi:replication protein P [Gammaproteobacteria bacterium]|nr:replication protein P [Gammaproteobacteria bacterium]
MKKADSLTGKITKDVAVATSSGRAEVNKVAKPDTKANAASGRHDHVDAINQVFAELELAYHNQYHKAYAQEGSIGLAKKYWLECLAHFSPEIILQATRTVVTSQEYLPSVASIVHACEEAMSGFGLPAAGAAYIEACCAPNPKAEQIWSHPTVYLAGKATGWFELANKTENQIFSRFEKNYRGLCQRALHGETLVIDRPEALPEQISRTLTLEENKSRMAELRKQLKTS